MPESSVDGLTDHKASWNSILQKNELKLTDLHNFLLNRWDNMAAAILNAMLNFLKSFRCIFRDFSMLYEYLREPEKNLLVMNFLQVFDKSNAPGLQVWFLLEYTETTTGSGSEPSGTNLN